MKKKRLRNLVDRPVLYTVVSGLVLPLLNLLVGGVIAGMLAGIIFDERAFDFLNEASAIVVTLTGILVALKVKKSLGEGFYFGFGRKGLGTGFLLALPMLTWSMLYIVQGALAEINPGVTAEDFLRPILTGTQPGVVEELFYRGIVFGGLMHFRAGKKNRVLVACLASTLVFSLTHMVNMIDGQSFIGTVNQLLFAFAVGGLFCASYLRSHNLWAPLFFHALHDSFAFFLVRTISGASTDGAPTLASILVDVLVLAYACYIIFSTKQETVDALWGAAKEEAEEEKEELVEEVSEI